MGLDMYLYARKHEYAGNYYKSKGSELTQEYPKEVIECFPEFDNDVCDAFTGEEKIKDDRSVCRNTYYEIGYWRKANAVHNWFVQKCGGGVDECQEIRVSKSDLEKLRDECKCVLENKDKAGEVLPTQDGFFFGGTEYDDWYYQGLEHTLEVANGAIALLDKDAGYDIVYQASW